jgi:hypothetical protein
MNKNLDELIDSALTNDSAKLPKQDELPDAALFAKFAATAAVVPPTTNTFSIGNLGIANMIMIAACTLLIGSATYFYITDTPSKPQVNSPAVRTTQSTQQQQPKDQAPITLSTKKKPVDSTKPVITTDTVAAKPHTIDEDLIHPTSKPNKYSADSTKVPLHAK